MGLIVLGSWIIFKQNTDNLGKVRYFTRESDELMIMKNYLL